MTEYNGVYGDFHWEVVGRTLKVFSGKRRVGLLKTFENVNAVNSEQAQWSAQAKIDLNLDALRQVEADKIRPIHEPTEPLRDPDMAYTDILYDTDGRLAFITLNRPEKLNALSNNLRGEVMDAMREAESNDEIGVIVLRGAGRSFSAGYDLSPARAADNFDFVSPRSGLPDTGSTHPGKTQWARHVVMTNWIIWELAKPVVAQIQGHCLAGGTELATVCDFRICADNAQIGYPPVRAMTTMDMMWTPWHLPPCKAREFAYVGDSFSGTEMARLGWANYAVAPDELGDFTEKFARRMAHVDNEMLMYSKRAVNRQYETQGIRDGLHSGTEIQALSAQRDAASEWGRRVRDDGLKAALEWRDGPFRDFRGAYASAPKDRAVAGMDPKAGDGKGAGYGD